MNTFDVIAQMAYLQIPFTQKEFPSFANIHKEGKEIGLITIDAFVNITSLLLLIINKSSNIKSTVVDLQQSSI